MHAISYLHLPRPLPHQEAVHILAGKILVVEINVHIRPVADASYSPEAVTRTGLPESSNLISLKGEFALRPHPEVIHSWANLVEFLVHVGKLAANRGNRH